MGNANLLKLYFVFPSVFVQISCAVSSQSSIILILSINFFASSLIVLKKLIAFSGFEPTLMFLISSNNFFS